MRILACGTGSVLPSLLEQRYVVEAMAVLPDYESGRAQLRGYQALLAGDRASSLDALPGLLEEAARGGVKTVFLYSPRTAGFPVPDGVLSFPVDVGEHEIAAALGLVRRPLEGNRVLIFYTIKGGTGKTTAAVLTSVALKQLFPEKKVILWDQDLPKGNVGLAFGRPDALTIEHLVREPQITPEILSRHIYHDGRTGVDLLLAPARSDVVVQLQANTFFHILSLLRATYDFVLLDFEPEIHRNEILVLALHEATDLMLVTDHSEFALDALRRLLPILAALDVRHKVRILFNNVWEEVSPEEQERIFHLPVLGVIPHNPEYEYAHRRHEPPVGKKLVGPFQSVARRLMEL